MKPLPCVRYSFYYIGYIKEIKDLLTSKLK